MADQTLTVLALDAGQEILGSLEGCANDVGAHETYLPALASNAFSTFSGVIGNSLIRTPMALTTAAAAVSPEGRLGQCDQALSRSISRLRTE